MIIKLKCSLAFLQGSIEKILDKTKKIGDQLTLNVLLFTLLPITPAAFLLLVDDLRAKQSRVKNGSHQDKLDRDTSFNAVNDAVHLIAPRVETVSANDPDVMNKSGFDPQKEKHTAPPPATPTGLHMRAGHLTGEAIGDIDLMEHCKIAIGRVSVDPNFPDATTTTVIGNSRHEVIFHNLNHGTDY